MNDERFLLPLVNNTITKPSSAKDLIVEKCSAIKACSINKIWHSRLPNIHWSNVVRSKDYLCYIAQYNYIVFAVGIWSSPVASNRFKNAEEMLELRRLAIAPDAPKYTATRMISLMIKDIKKEKPHINRLISYQDTAVHDGTIYKASNWQNTAETNFKKWNTKNRKRSKEQATGNKIRWEYQIKGNENE